MTDNFISISILFMIVILVIGCKSHKPVIISDSMNSSNRLISLQTDCDKLKLLSDSSFISRQKKPDTIIELMDNLFVKAGLTSNRICGSGTCFYYSFSLEKSIYKIDVVRLMQYYKCPDTVKLKAMTSGTFNSRELQTIDSRSRTFFPIDTTILYNK